MRQRFFLYVLTCILILVGCDSSEPEEAPPPLVDETVVASIIITTNQRKVIGTGVGIQLVAEARDASRTPLKDVAFTWTSTDESVATIDTTGIVTTTGIGKVRIEAETDGVVGSIELEALPAGVHQLTISTPYQVLPGNGYTVQLTLSAQDALGQPISEPDLKWSSSQPDVIDVDDTGQITTGTFGEARVFVESGDAETLINLEVVTTTGSGIPELDLELLSIFKQNTSSGVLVAPPGMSAALVVEDRLVMARGYGLASTGSVLSPILHQPVQPNSLFRIASISKPVTAVSILKLIEQGRLSLEDSLLSVVPNLIPPGGLADEQARGIRMWTLLEHKGGWDRSISLNPFYRLNAIAQEMGVAPPPSHEVVAHWLLGQAFDFAPGSRYSYNGMNYFMLGQVIEAVTGQPYESFVQQEILAPAGITSMQVGKTLIEDRVEGEVEYHYGGLGPSIFNDVSGSLPGQYGGGFDMELLSASGGWIASVIDLARFGRAFHRKQILMDDLLHEYMLTDNSGNGVYGAGWILDGRNYLHTGGLEGTNSLLYVFQDGTILALLFNGNSSINLRRWLEPITARNDWPAIDLFDQY